MNKKKLIKKWKEELSIVVSSREYHTECRNRNKIAICCSEELIIRAILEDLKQLK